MKRYDMVVPHRTHGDRREREAPIACCESWEGCILFYSFMACNEKQAHATPAQIFPISAACDHCRAPPPPRLWGGCGVNPPPPSPSPRFISKLPSTQHPRDCHRETQVKGPFSFWRYTRYYACVPRAHHLCSPCHRSTQTFFINNLIFKNNQLFFYSL